MDTQLREARFSLKTDKVGGKAVCVLKGDIRAAGYDFAPFFGRGILHRGFDEPETFPKIVCTDKEVCAAMVHIVFVPFSAEQQDFERILGAVGGKIVDFGCGLALGE